MEILQILHDLNRPQPALPPTFSPDSIRCQHLEFSTRCLLLVLSSSAPLVEIYWRESLPRQRSFCVKSAVTPIKVGSLASCTCWCYLFVSRQMAYFNTVDL